MAGAPIDSAGRTALGGARRLLGHPYLLHLRLNFNLLLAPVYLYGVVTAGGRVAEARFWLGFLSLHLFLYGGTTAFNSYYDRDEGPIGGLLKPPPVDLGLLRFSLVVQALGLVPAALLGPEFFLAWLALFLVFTAYSHPLARLKARPSSALAAIALGQGALGFALGWLAVSPDILPLTAPALLGMASTALVVTGLYLISQSYQVHEDRQRGDVTIPVLLGARGALLVALLPLAAGGLLLAWQLALPLGPAWLLALLLFFAGLAAWLVGWALRLDETAVERNYAVTMRFLSVASGGLTLVLLLRLVVG
ncbi:MAG TPA: UbiA family prenyltransferase [Trueperaceae bacterium]